jgi:hypothetical protein
LIGGVDDQLVAAPDQVLVAVRATGFGAMTEQHDIAALADQSGSGQCQDFPESTVRLASPSTARWLSPIVGI